MKRGRQAAPGAARGGAASDTRTGHQAYTIGSASAEFAERDKGSLTPGKLADLAVLSQDIFTVDPTTLPGTRAVLTIVDGRIVRDELTVAREVRPH